MNITVTQENLTKALNAISRVATSRNELAILNNILLRTDGGRLVVAATNLEIAATQYVGAKVETPGSITIPARLMSDFISGLPAGVISLSAKDNHLHITSGKFSSVINGVVADEFPELPTIDEANGVTITLSTEELKRAVAQTIVATSSDMTRAVLTGVYWHTHEGALYLAATDGYRLAERRLMPTEAEIAAVIPASTLQEVLRSLDESVEEVAIVFNDAQVGFQTPQMELVSRLIDGAFPNYRQLIPASSETTAVIDKADFSRITKIASLFARDSGGGITLSADEEASSLSVHSVASELGENTSEAAAKVKGNGTVTLNSRYLIEALAVTDGSVVEFAFSGKLAPCIIKEAVKQTDYMHIIMPMKS